MKNFRFLTAGESHGKCLSAIVEGMPSGISIDIDFINSELARRQKGHGRGDRMNLEKDFVEIKSGVRFAKTTGAPITLEIQNKDWENWKIPMSIEKINFSDREILRKIAQKSFTKPRPGHADLAGSIKYNLEDLRDVLERASARKTAIEVAVGALAKMFLKEFCIIGFSHVTQIGSIKAEVLPSDYTTIKEKAEISLVHCADEVAAERMKEEINIAHAAGDSLGGTFEVIFGNLPIGLGSYVHWDRALDGAIAQAVMSIPAIKSVEIGRGAESAELFGSEMQDQITFRNEKFMRLSNNAGGIEGGMSNGEPILVRASMKPIPTIKKSLASVDLLDNSSVFAHAERSDTCAVPACAVIAEARIACVLADEFLSKFGGDSLEEIKKHYE